VTDHSPQLNDPNQLPSIRLRDGLIIYTLFVALAAVMTWPVIAQLGQAVPGHDGDVYIRLWTHRWVRDTLLAGASPFFTDAIFFPTGISLASHNIAWLNIAAWLPLQTFLSEAAAYTIVYLNILALNGLSAYLLVFEYTRSKLPAFIGGLIVAFWPLILSHHHQPNIIIIAWVILAMLFLKRTVEQSRLRDAILFGIFLALIGISRWQMLIIGGVLIAGYSLFLITQPGRLTRRNIMLIALSGVLSVIIMLPFLWTGVQEFVLSPTTGDVFDVGPGANIDILALFTPSRWHPLWGFQISDFYSDHFGLASLFVPFVGYGTLILVILGLILKWRDARMWFVLALVLLVFSLGDDLRIGGVPYLPLPYKFLREINLIGLIRHPLRFGIVLAIPAAIMAGYGALAIQTHPRLRLRYSKIVLLIFIGIILFEYATTTMFPVMSLQVPTWFEDLAKDPEDFGIVNIPLSGNSNNEAYMFYQITHGKHIAGGKIARVPEMAYAFIDRIPMLERSRYDSLLKEDVLTVAAQFSKLSENNIRYLVLHKVLLGETETDAWKTWLDLPPVYEDSELVVYYTTLPEPATTSFFATDAGKVGVVDYSVGTPTVTQSYPLAATIGWVKTEPVAGELRVCFDAVGEDNFRFDLGCFPISVATSFEDWPMRAVLETEYIVLMDPYMESGQYAIEFALVSDQRHFSAEEKLILGDVKFSAFPRTIIGHTEENPIAIWDDIISLNAFEIKAETGTRFKVDLRLQALSRITESYKIFAHLVHVESGEIIAQTDIIPRQWTYPTTWWEQYEIVTDSIDITHDTLAPGHYQLWLGFYDEVSLDRLLVSPTDGVTGSEAMDAVMLYEFER